MKVVIYIYHFPRFSETFIARKFLYLLQKGIDVHVVAWPSNEQHLFPEVQPYLKRVHYLHLTKNKIKAFFYLLYAFLKTFIKDPALTIKYFKITTPLYGITKALKKFYSEYPILLIKPDIIHFEYITIFKEHHHLKDILNFKAIASFRGHDVVYTGIDEKDYYKDVFSKLDAIHTIANYLVKYAKKYRGLPSNFSPIRKIPPAIPSDLLEIEKNYSTRNGVSEPVRILTVGRLHWAKGYEYILKALNILKDRGIKFHYRIIGEGPLKEMLVYLINFFDLEESVEMLGKLSFSETIEHYKWADIFIIGTLWGSLKEGFSNAVLEAQAMGLPVVAGEYTENMKYLQREKFAIPVERRNPEDIADKLQLLIENPAERKIIGMRAREFVKNYHTIDKQAEDFCRFYTEILGEVRK